MYPASNNPGGQPPLPPSQANPKDTKSGSGRRRNNTKSRHNSAAFPNRERGDQSCYALNCSTPIPTYAIRKYVTILHAGLNIHQSDVSILQ